MYRLLVALDHALFTAINSLPHTLLSDTASLFFSFLGSFGLVWYLLAAYIFIAERGKKDCRFVVSMILAGILSVVLVSFVFKPYFARERPFVRLGSETIVVNSDWFRENIYDEFAFPSGHTTIAFAAAYILSHKKPRHRSWFYFLAGLIAFSRIYLGKHYPLDILGGIMLGVGIGWVSVRAVHKKGFR